MTKFLTLRISFFYNFKPRKVFSPVIDKEDLTTLKRFAMNKNLVISTPDKGNGVVIVDKITYLSSMMKIINDKSKFNHYVINNQ